MPNLITIDPGANSVGVAVWDRPRWKEKCGPKFTVLVRPKSAGRTPYIGRGLDIAFQIERLIQRHDVAKAWIEYPAFFQGTAKGYMAASAGDLVKLAVSVGILIGYLPCAVEIVPVAEWKGQLSKLAVRERIRRRLGRRVCEEFTADVWDAVGIGLYLKGMI